MRWYRLFDVWTPQVFSPKVMPDAGSAERLDEKFQELVKKLKADNQSAATSAATRRR